MERRFTPLAVCLGVALVALVARLWDIQVVQHELWAAESANLVRSYEIDPYRRGTIRDAKGRTLVRDEEVYALEFVWRDFRRGHPLGQVTMMRSLAAMRPVGLDETREVLREAALGYALLSPDALDVFAAGGELYAGPDYVPPVPVPRSSRSIERARRERARRDRRGPRARDIAFYVRRLLGLSNAETRRLNDLVRDVDGASARSYLDLVGEITDQSTADVAEALEARVVAAEERLARLADLVDWEDADQDPEYGIQSPGDRLVRLIEEQRRSVDDDAADALFQIAAGFSSSRLDADILARFELDWLRAALDWDGLRLQEWIEARGTVFSREVRAWRAGHTIARSKLGDEDPTLAGDTFVSAMAHAFRADPDQWTRRSAAPQDWRQVDELGVLDKLPSRLAHGEVIEDAARAPVLPFQDPELRTSPKLGAELIERVFEDALPWAVRRATERELDEDWGELEWPITKEDFEAAYRDRLADAGTMLVDMVRDTKSEWTHPQAALVGALLEALHAGLQDRIRALLDLVQAEHSGPLEFAAPALEKALETRPYVLRDRGGRARTVGGQPQMDLVLLVTCYPDDFAGFHVRTQTDRVPVAFGPNGRTPLASMLVGNVRTPRLMDVLRHEPDQERLAELQRKLVLPDEDRDQILELVDHSFREGEMVGAFGLEAWLDPDLVGEDGYIEWQGLQDHVSENREPIYRGARDGEDVWLTLDADLQFAAESVLFDPVPPTHLPEYDESWFRFPVGAIVLARVNGDVLAAASAPFEPHDFAPEESDGEYRNASERTLSRPRFQPPGSVVKPLLAAYALEYRGLDPGRGLVRCEPMPGGRLGTAADGDPHPGWGDVDCATRKGHSVRSGLEEISLHEAITVSCNTYFAALGELEYDGESIGEAYRLFGFGQPTGVRFDDNGRRSGLNDSYWYSKDGKLRPENAGRSNEVARQLLGNGLSHVNASVMQIARAYAGLATGVLPEMRLVDRIGSTVLPRRGVSLGISEASLDVVRDAVRSVVQKTYGSAHNKKLDEQSLGFTLAAKTGSADYRPTDVRGPMGSYMRKHTWLAGYFPADDPQFVVTIYLHDTTVTSSRSAVYVASQFLRRPEVHDFVLAEIAREADAAEAAASAAPVEAAAPVAEDMEPRGGASNGPTPNRASAAQPDGGRVR